MWNERNDRCRCCGQDEPTNYLDNDTLAALTHALKSFKVQPSPPILDAITKSQSLTFLEWQHGGVIVISHNVKFVNALCNEWWTVSPPRLP